ncbi:type II toxin-antitoxin system ParD family antitoxin [Roseomonas sp. KE2513]|uniref:type II toxin-antitoxin system ParD family antitoxin n=1 Tax=Roseomonas sp. KE2513 TaxID=2479202 RepID=UPI0018DF3BD7|nr:type II toxin-antitoxin system ParD family antitoxin [Roseomonas sp. KE2513]MBI0539554.1 type II toxin-antitoxin system ParD family antitoxin [Roseomonas sp. KE2513]
MRHVTTLNISLTPELRAFIADHVASGRFGSASEVVRAALRAFERAEADQTPAQAVKVKASPR